MKNIIVIVAIFLAGCAAALTPEAEKVRIVTANQKEKCQVIKLIMESQKLGPDKPNGALRNALNATAAAGGNAFYLLSSNSDWADGASISGEALSCK
jgi:hypothetical protein